VPTGGGTFGASRPWRSTLPMVRCGRLPCAKRLVRQPAGLSVPPGAGRLSLSPRAEMQGACRRLECGVPQAPAGCPWALTHLLGSFSFLALTALRATVADGVVAAGLPAGGCHDGHVWSATPAASSMSPLRAESGASASPSSFRSQWRCSSSCMAPAARHRPRTTTVASTNQVAARTNSSMSRGSRTVAKGAISNRQGLVNPSNQRRPAIQVSRQ
jgi:hypothetical protein